MKTLTTILFLFLSVGYIHSQIDTDSLIKSKDNLIKQRIKNNVFIEEVNNTNREVIEVESAIPAFIGYTQIAKKQQDLDLILKPTKISSLAEYEKYFGFPNDDKITISLADDGKGGYKVLSFKTPDLKYMLYYNLKMFFANGGTKCYIVSVGTYQSKGKVSLNGIGGKNPATAYGLINGLEVVSNEDEPTLVVISEAVKLLSADYQTLARSVLLQCKNSGDRFGIFDIYDGNSLLDASSLDRNRSYFGNEGLKYGAAYYPFIETLLNYYINDKETNVDVEYNGSLASLSDIKLKNPVFYKEVRNKLKEYHIVLPPSAAIAGIYVSNDKSRGVWKAPANLKITEVKAPVIKMDKTLQENCNIDPVNGISINQIQEFTGKGTMVWGARTLAGNDNEWRYINVRRFFNVVEESVKESTAWVVFEPNNANTWAKVRGMIENYLMQKWRNGTLAGSKPNEAFFVRCALGETMTNQDILDGNLNIEIGMAVVRPSEFIILKIRHKMN